MPTYEYQCPDCRHRFEKFQAISDKPVKTCPKCKKRKVKRLISSGAGILLKGSGFYATDYRSESYKKDAKKDAQAAKEGSGSGTAETKKPAEKKPAADKKEKSADTRGKKSKS
jgi:putative FmdB family regulatory protein